VDIEPSEEELSAFIESMLANFNRELREPDVIEETIREHREMWVKIYRASLGFEVRDAPS
jgi:hypothetical protein